MPIEFLKVTSKFARQYNKLSKKVQQETKAKELVFRANPFDSRLKTHKLHGKDREAWGFWITKKHRIKFIFLGNDAALFLEVGTHDIYQ